MDQYTLFNQAPQEGKTTIYRSSAGSGKTFTLTKAYLKLVLLDPSRYKEILAITFTNDAKNEMQTRILSELSQIAEGKSTDMRVAIIDDFRTENIENIKDVMTSRAQTALNNLLHDYSRFHISTIDHFFAQLIRHLARELKLNLGYELDIDVESALNESVKTLFSTANDELLLWLKDFALAQINDDKGWNIQKSITTLGKKLFQESYLDIRDKLDSGSQFLSDFIKKQQKIIDESKKTLTQLGKQGMQALESNQVELEDLKGKTGGPISILLKLSKRQYDYKKRPTDTFLNAIEVTNWHTANNPKINQIESAWANGLCEAQQHVSDFYQGEKYLAFIEADAILKYIHSYGVLAALAKQVQDYRNNHNLLLISDTAMILTKVIEEQEMPFIYEKIGSKFKYVLIDEFQDTSMHQWNSLLPFLKNAIDQGGQLIIVGDVKQAIYGWRGGDMNLLLNQVENDLAIDENSILNLNTNYRSGKNIVEFNNTFFKLAPQNVASGQHLDTYVDQFEKAYQDVHQNTHKSFAGYVRIQFLQGDTDNSWQHQAIENTLYWIDSSIQDGFNYSDILILVRANAEAQEIAQHLIQANIPTISDEALQVDTSNKVKLLLSALKVINNREDRVSVAEFNFFSKGNEHENLTQLREPSDLLINLLSYQNKPLYELVEELVILLELNLEPNIYLQRFLDICLEQSKSGNSTVGQFLDWWSSVKDRNSSSELSIGLPKNNNAVRLMTIHKAKGLEKPIVIVPYADSSLSPRANSIFWANPLPETYNKWGSLPLAFNKSLAETKFGKNYQEELLKNSLEALNLLYVAFTRAEQRLIIFTNTKSTNGNTGNLIKKTIDDAEFNMGSTYDENAGLFTIGEPTHAEKVHTEIDHKIVEFKSAPTSLLSEKIIMDDRPSKLFMAYKNERSNKIKEGLLLHLALSRLSHSSRLDFVLKKIKLEQSLDAKTVALLKDKIKALFNAIPGMNSWFDGSWQVINERTIYQAGRVHIPDRIMIKNKQAIIIDYKRETQDQKHHKQVNRYAALLLSMGYEIVDKYLIYINEPLLVEVE